MLPGSWQLKTQKAPDILWQSKVCLLYFFHLELTRVSCMLPSMHWIRQAVFTALLLSKVFWHVSMLCCFSERSFSCKCNSWREWFQYVICHEQRICCYFAVISYVTWVLNCSVGPTKRNKLLFECEEHRSFTSLKLWLCSVWMFCLDVESGTEHCPQGMGG